MRAPWLLFVKWTAILLLVESGESQPAPPPPIPRPERSQILSPAELDKVAGIVIEKLKQINPNGKAVVIGGAALQKHVPGHRPTFDIDIYQTAGSSIDIKKKFLNDPTFYTRQTKTDNIDITTKLELFHRDPITGKNIEIDLPGTHVLKFEPASAKVLKDIPAGKAPYLSPEELVVSKIQSSQGRIDAKKKAIDISDAKAVLDKYPKETFTSDNNRQITEKFFREHTPLQPKPHKNGLYFCNHKRALPYKKRAV